MMLHIVGAKRKRLYVGALLIAISLLWYQNVQLKAIGADSVAQESQSQAAYQINVQTKINQSQDAYALVRLGLLLQEKDEQALALAAIQKAVELDPKWRDGHWSLAVAYLHWADTLNPSNKQEAKEYQERLSAAKHSLKQCLVLDPGFEEARDILKQLEG